MLGELWTRMALLPKAEPGLVAKAGGKFSYATGFARWRIPLPCEVRGCSRSALATIVMPSDLLRALAIAQPWDIEDGFCSRRLSLARW